MATRLGMPLVTAAPCSLVGFFGSYLLKQLVGWVIRILLLPFGILCGKLLRILPQGLLQDCQFQPTAADVRCRLFNGFTQLCCRLRREQGPDRCMVGRTFVCWPR